MTSAQDDNDKLRVVVLLSGNGSNLQALIDATNDPACNYTIVGVLSNRDDAYGLQRAAAAGIPQQWISHKTFAGRTDFDQAMIDVIDQYKPELVVLAGFMRILTPEFVEHYQGNMINIHPSLLPKYTGLYTHQRVLAAGDTHHGISIHFVTEDLDSGPVILQARLRINPGDTEEILAKRVLALEHIYYPQVVSWYADGRLAMYNGKVVFDQQALDAPVIFDAD
jgi:phosphoribosylglycinamide formyltransferase-1